VEAVAANPSTFTITASFNGVNKPVRVVGSQSMMAVFEHVLQAFEATGQKDALALFPEGSATPFDLNQSAEAAGLRQDAVVILRARQARGG
jgi:hypothetical protein